MTAFCRPLSAELMKRVAITYTRKVLAEDGRIDLVPLPPSRHPPAACHVSPLLRSCVVYHGGCSLILSVQTIVDRPSAEATSRAGVKAVAPDKRLRVGYVSADFKDHPVAKRMQDVYGLHDRQRVSFVLTCVLVASALLLAHGVRVRRQPTDVHSGWRRARAARPRACVRSSIEG
jgi:hypothetical protein